MLADLILIIHLLYVLFVVGGLLAIWIGAALEWEWVRNPWFRAIHLGAIGYVALETILDIDCPLTVWESRLREPSGEGVYEAGFIEHWVHRVIFYDAPAFVFTALYLGFTLLVIGSMVLIKPSWHHASRRQKMLRVRRIAGGR